MRWFSKPWSVVAWGIPPHSAWPVAFRFAAVAAPAGRTLGGARVPCTRATIAHVGADARARA